MREMTVKFAGIRDVITSVDDVCAVIGTPMPHVVAKVTDKLDDICRTFLAKSPFCLIASSNPDGAIDVSPKGDPLGFVRVLNEKHLAIPDRPGNRKIDTFHNLLKDPRVGLIFIIPGKRETLRISGEARITRDEELRKSMAIDGKTPELALVVYVERVFMHCPKCLVRSQLWEPATWPNHVDMPSYVEIIIRHAKLNTSPEQLVTDAKEGGLMDLY